jgi:hypothetical protein
MVSVYDRLVSIKEVSETMRSMAREMEHSGLIEEIIGDTMEALDDPSLESVADAEVERVMLELTTGVFTGTGATPSRALQAPVLVQAEEEMQTSDDVLQRLQALG